MGNLISKPLKIPSTATMLPCYTDIVKCKCYNFSQDTLITSHNILTTDDKSISVWHFLFLCLIVLVNQTNQSYHCLLHNSQVKKVRSERSVYAYTGVTVQNDRSVLLYQVIEQQWICTWGKTSSLGLDRWLYILLKKSGWCMILCSLFSDKKDMLGIVH